MKTTTKKRKKAAKFDHATIVKMTVEIEKLKTQKRLPTTLDEAVNHLTKVLGCTIAESTVKNVCENLNVHFYGHNAKTRQSLYNQVKQVHWRREMVKAFRQVVANIETEMDLESGCLLACGVDEMLKNAIAGAGTMKNFELPAEAIQKDLPLVDRLVAELEGEAEAF